MNKIITALLILSLTACANSVTFVEAAQMNQVGFWYGLWHGATFPISFIGSLFSDSISIYAIYNNGGWYDFGFFLGIGILTATIYHK